MLGPSEALTLPGHPDLRRFVCALLLACALATSGIVADEGIPVLDRCTEETLRAICGMVTWPLA